MNERIRYRTFNIRFLNPDGDGDETQFDVVDGSFEQMINELLDLFNDFCNDFFRGSNCRIIQIEETEYDGEG